MPEQGWQRGRPRSVRGTGDGLPGLKQRILGGECWKNRERARDEGVGVGGLVPRGSLILGREAGAASGGWPEMRSPYAKRWSDSSVVLGEKEQQQAFREGWTGGGAGLEGP